MPVKWDVQLFSQSHSSCRGWPVLKIVSLAHCYTWHLRRHLILNLNAVSCKLLLSEGRQAITTFSFTQDILVMHLQCAKIITVTHCICCSMPFDISCSYYDRNLVAYLLFCIIRRIIMGWTFDALHSTAFIERVTVLKCIGDDVDMLHLLGIKCLCV